MNINKLKNKAFQILLILAIFSVNANALTISPATGTGYIGLSQTFTLYAAPNTDNVSGIQLRLHVYGSTITNFAPTGALQSLGSGCAGSALYTDNDVCTEFASLSGFITTGTSLGTLTVTWNDAGTFTFSKNGTAYFNDYDSLLYTDNGSIGSYIISSTAPSNTPTLTPTSTPISGTPSIGTTLPSTGMTSLTTFLSGFLFIGIGVYLNFYVRKNKISNA